MNRREKREILHFLKEEGLLEPDSVITPSVFVQLLGIDPYINGQENPNFGFAVGEIKILLEKNGFASTSRGLGRGYLRIQPLHNYKRLVDNSINTATRIVERKQSCLTNAKTEDCEKNVIEELNHEKNKVIALKYALQSVLNKF